MRLLPLLAMLVFLLPPAPATASAPKTGQKAPQFAAMDQHATPFNLKKSASSLKNGGAVVLLFWSTTCKSCKNGLKAAEELAKDPAMEHNRFVLVTCDQPDIPKEQRNSQVIRSFLSASIQTLVSFGLSGVKIGGKLKVLWDVDLQIARKYGIFDGNELKLPLVVVVDRGRFVRAIWTEEDSTFKRVLTDALKTVNARESGGQ